MIADYHPLQGDDNIDFLPGVLIGVGFEAGIGISMKFRYGRSSYRIFSMESQAFLILYPWAGGISSSLLEGWYSEEEGWYDPDHPQNIYHSSFSGKPES